MINEAILRLHRWYRAHVPASRRQCIAAEGRYQPGDAGQICGCTTQLVSGSQYEEFIAPLDAAVLAEYPDGGMVHLCGVHAQHIPCWARMKALRAVQLNDRAAADLGLHFAGLRDDQVLYVHIGVDMPEAEALAITGGSRVVLVG